MEVEVGVEEAVDAEEEEAAMTAELELLTSRLGVEGAHEQELAACLVVLISLQVSRCRVPGVLVCLVCWYSRKLVDQCLSVSQSVTL